MLSKDLIGTRSGPFEYQYTWRDLILYAVGVGAHSDELYYLYEKDLKAIPSFGAVPFVLSPISLSKKFLSDLRGMLHGENELIQYRPLSPHGGKIFYESIMEHVYDRGPGKGGKMVIRTEVYDIDGNLLFENRDHVFALFDGGFGGESPPKRLFKLPDRKPDIEELVTPAPNQNYLYRLTGDYFPVHADPEFARQSGFERPIMHGLCTYGYACRIAIKHLFSREPERLRRFNACFMKPLYPGVPIGVQIWKTEEHKALFQVVNKETGEITLGTGEIEWRPKD
jgi:acyl dehydratase